MTQKTAMQQMLEWVTSNYPNFNAADIEAKIEELLATEKEQGIEFGKWLAAKGWTPYHLNMWEHPSDEIASTETLYEDFYNQTYGKERL